MGRVFLWKFVFLMSTKIITMKNLILFAFAILAFSMASCQGEEDVQVVNTQENLTKTSTLTSLMARVVQNPTFHDNCIDDSSCFSVVLPVTVTINGQQVTVSDDSDYDTIKGIKNQSNADDDIIHFAFPITLKYPNFQEAVINNQNELDAAKASCDPGSFHEIGCIDFNYPFVINYYNKVTQTPGTLTVDSNVRLYNFLTALKADDIYTIVYPLSLTKSNGSTSIYNTNLQLQAGIENVIHDCDTPDDTDPELTEIIVSGSWYVSSFIDEGEDETYQFNGYSFTFNANGTAVATKTAVPNTNGSWSIYPDGGYTKLEISFDGNTVREIEEDWRVIEYTETMIKLRHQSGGGGGENHYLTLTKI